MANVQAQYGAEEMLYSSTTLVSIPIIISLNNKENLENQQQKIF